MFTTNPVQIGDLLNDVHTGKIQLPDFQRGWIWDDDRIKDLLVSICRSFPVGAVMTLSADGEISFRHRMIEGAPNEPERNLERYLLDGQQRLTSLYQAFTYPGPVETRDSRGHPTTRWYYLNMQAALNGAEIDLENLVFSMPENRVETGVFGREGRRNLSSKELEFKNHAIPTERALDSTTWMVEYIRYWNSSEEPHPDGDPMEFFVKFKDAVLDNITKYQLPVINLDKDTTREAVCTVFEKVNTGGVTLSVFELLTASLAADDFSLRDDWRERRRRMCEKYGLLQAVGNTNFLQAVALLVTQERQRRTPPGQPRPGIGCKRPDILNLTINEYQAWADQVEQGFVEAAKFLYDQFVFTEKNIPYTTQLVPLAAIHAELGRELEPYNARQRLERWYWCGILGEMYNGPTETMYASDLPEVAEYVRKGTEPRLVREANFSPNRLISLRTRNSAAYKGLYALQMKNDAQDWRTGHKLIRESWEENGVEIHHIFPKHWCNTYAKPAIPSSLHDSIINKAPIDAATNRSIGGRAPSAYIRNLRNANRDLDQALESHWINQATLASDDFNQFFVERGEALLNLIAQAMGKPTSGGREVLQEVLHNAGMIDRDTADNINANVEFEEEEFDDFGNAEYASVLSAADD